MADNISIEKLHDERMWVITLKEGNRAGVDAWEQAVRSYWAEAKRRFGQDEVAVNTRYLIYDTTPIKNLGFTNYLQQRATVMAREDGKATGRVALVINIAPTILYFFDIFVRLTGSQLQPKLTVKFFSKREEAIDWVASAVAEKV